MLRSQAYQTGVSAARAGYMMASHYRKAVDVEEFEAGYRSVCRDYIAISTEQGTKSIVLIGTQRECDDAAITHKARYPKSKVEVIENLLKK